MRRIFLCWTLLLCASCTTITNAKIKNDIAKRLFDLFDKHTSEVSDDNIASVADTRRELTKPFDLAVYFKNPSEKENWRWTVDDKEEVLNSISKNKKIIKNAFELINTSGTTSDLKKIRMMAAEQGADAVLVIQGAGDVKTEANGLAATYVAIVPMFFVNGNTVKSGFVTQAVMWDVRQSFVHVALQSEGDWNMKRPLAFRQKERALSKAKEESLINLEKQLQRKLKI